MAKWTRAYIDSLPDSAFLLVLPGGEKTDGYTEPKSKRKFPVYDAKGKLDKDHLDDALSRIPQSKLSDQLKNKAQARAEKLLAQWKKENGKLKKSLGDYSYNDLRQELQSIVQQKYGTKSKDGDYWTNYPWIVDVYEDEFVVEKDGKYYIAEYKVKDGEITIGEFYKAKKVYRQVGKTPVAKLGTRPSASVDISG